MRETSKIISKVVEERLHILIPFMKVNLQMANNPGEERVFIQMVMCMRVALEMMSDVEKESFFTLMAMFMKVISKMIIGLAKGSWLMQEIVS
jgi:hypothetical protein